MQKCRRQGFASLSKRRRQDSAKINSEELELGIEMRHAQKPCACTTGPIKGSDDNQEFLPGLREARGCDAAKSAKTKTTGNSRENIFAYVSTAQPAGMARPLASAQIATSEFMQLWIEKMLDAGLPFRPKKLRPAQRQSGPPVQTSIAFSAF
ncbi:hypothetical protein [Pedomonas mirosovicensis]|uniref:hypothetical protein n=1 Tax=Pedomonas mirosovicensis TaxID=2908641 RepID=UPI0021687CD5|nr:hypothetical protein [Pedomonas mirosovicensis]MCH8686291.1 hypothetical protein [Pedomonas mirosovicensis]